MSTNLQNKLYSKLLLKTLSYASIITFIIFASMSQASAGKVEISLSYNDPAPVSAPNSVDLTAPAVTEGSFATETGWPIDPTLSYAYFLDEDLTLPISDPVHITRTGRYYIKAKAYSHTGTLYTSSGSIWVTIDQVICTNSYISPETSGVVPAFTWAEPVIDPVGAITGGNAQATPTPIIGMLLNNTTNAPATAKYTIQVFQNGVPFQFPLKIEVYPQGKVTQINNFNTCSSDILSTIHFETINIGGTTSYTWTNSLPSIGLPESGTGDIASFEVVNTGTIPLVATIEVTPTYNNSISCTGPQNVMIFTITVNPIPILSSNLLPAAICSGAKFEYSPTCAVSGATFSWSRATIPGIMQVGAVGTGNVNEVLTNSTSKPIIVTYAYTISANGCSNTQEVKIPVLGNLTANISGGTSPICYNTDPGILTVTGSGGSGSYSYLWYKDGISTGITTPTYSPGILDSTSKFYCAITNGSCGTVNTSTKTITVFADLTANISGGTSPICYNTDSGTLTATGIGGTGSYSYMWYKDGKSTSVTTPTYSPGILDSTSVFYCAITSGSCGTVNTNMKTITVLADLTANISGGTSNICFNTAPGSLTATGSGGSGSYTYLWYKDGISTGITTQTYAPGNISSTSTFYCAVTSGSCGTVSTSTKTITVLSDLTANISGGTSPICYNSAPGTLAATGSGGTGSYSYLWYKDGISTGVTTQAYMPGNLSSTSTFYCAISSGSCGTVSTSIITITVLADLTANISGGTSPVCYNTAPGILTATGGGGSGSYSYLWYKDGIPTDITTQTYTPGNLISTSIFYCEITNGSCGKVNSSVKTISITPTVTISAFSPALSSRRQGAGSITITTKASNNSSPVVYSLDPITAAFAGNSINATSGEVTFSSTWSGITTITASAAGCNGPATTTHHITTYIPSIALIKVGSFIDKAPIGVVNPGDQINYKFTVTNTGGVVLTNITVTDPLVIVTGGPISSLTPGSIDNITFTATYTITQEDINAGGVTNQATVKGTPPNGSDITDFSDDDSNLQNEKTITVLTQSPAWSILKDALETSYSAVGELLHYNIAVSNKGNVYIENLVVLDPGSDAGSIVYLSGDLNKNNKLDPAEVWNYSAIHTVTQFDMTSGHYFNTVQVKGSPSGGTLLPAIGSKDIFAKQTLTIRNGSATEGDNVVFQVALNNPGLSEVTFVPVLSGGTAIIGVDTGSEIEFSNTDGSTWTKCNHCTISIPPGVPGIQLRVPTINDNLEEQTETFTISATVTSANTVNSSASGIGTITDNDDYPIAVDDILTIDEDSQLKANCSVNDIPNSANNKWTLVKQPIHGKIQMNQDGTFTYTPDADYNGNDNFSYKLCDLDGDCDDAIVFITVKPVNDSPDANNDEFIMRLDDILSESVTGNDVPSPDGGNIWSIVTPPTGGIVTFNSDGSFNYTTNSNFNGSDTFVYKLCDQDGSCDQATVTISGEDIVPNQILTPDDDGNNDTFFIENIEFYPENRTTIYNRWGNIVYQKSGYLNEWDGFSNVGKVGSKAVPAGTYYYVIDYGKNRHKVGYVYLQRSN
jgi:large repetitive protein